MRGIQHCILSKLAGFLENLWTSEPCSKGENNTVQNEKHDPYDYLTKIKKSDRIIFISKNKLQVNRTNGKFLQYQNTEYRMMANFNNFNSVNDLRVEWHTIRKDLRNYSIFDQSFFITYAQIAISFMPTLFF